MLENTQLLESVGLDVKVFICGNISTNCCVFTTMSSKEMAVLEQDPTMQHPTNPNKQVTFTFNPVHNMCIRNNFFRDVMMTELVPFLGISGGRSLNMKKGLY